MKDKDSHHHRHRRRQSDKNKSTVPVWVHDEWCCKFCGASGAVEVQWYTPAGDVYQAMAADHAYRSPYCERDRGPHGIKAVE